MIPFRRAGHQNLKPLGQDWILSPCAPIIRKLDGQQHIQRRLFDSQHIAGLVWPDFPGERLLVCYNPLVVAWTRRKRNALL